MAEERPRRTTYANEQRKNKSSGWQLIAVQSISCVIVILITLVFRMIGGSAFDQLRDSFNKSIMSNSVMATIAALFEPAADGDADDDENSETDKGTIGSTGTSQTENTTSTSGSAASTTAASTAATTVKNITTAPSSATTTSPSKVSAAGGKDIPVLQKKVMYAPVGATFAPLKVNRLANKPLESGEVTSYFGYRINPTSGVESFHQGLDIAAKQNSQISALYFGVVSEVGLSAGYGNYVRIFHGNGLEVLYAHCSQILVDKDAVIRAGEIVARVGSTGDSTGPHVHIEVKLNGIAYDPAGIVLLDNYA